MTNSPSSSPSGQHQGTHPTPPASPRRHWLLLTTTLGAAWLAGCASPAPLPTEYRLSLDAPAGVGAAPAAPAASSTAASPAASGQVWQLPSTLRLPAYLDRESMQLPGDGGTLMASSQQRWAEPLREAIPRVLRQDLSLWLGTRQVWLGPPPAAWPATRQLRLEVLAFEPLPSRSAVRLQARWSIEDPTGRAPAVVAQADLSAPSRDGSPAALVQAHRLALWRLAESIAASAASNRP